MTDRRLRAAIAAVSVAGAALAAYLTATTLLAQPVLCPTSGCEVVLSSRYAELAGVPVSALGLVAYLALLGSALHPRGAFPGAVVALGAAGFAAYLVVVQVALIGAVCALCMASHVLMLALVVLALVRLRSADAHSV